jgi:hypothetical protein
MATFVPLPAEIHLAILENLAEKNIDDLYSLILASKTHQEVFKAYWRPVLRKAGTTILPTHPELLWAAIQAQCSAGDMHLDGDAAAGDELNAWSVSDPKHDIWSIEYAGDKMEALEALVRLDHDIEELMDSLSILSFSHRIPPIPYYSLRAIGLDPVHEDIRHLSPFYPTRVDVRAAVWLQEMMRRRNQNRDGGTLRSWFQRWLNKHDTLDPDLSLDQMLHALVHEAAGGGTCCAADQDRLRESEVYFRYLKRVEKEYAGARDLGRRIQRILHASFVEEKYESGMEFAEFRGLSRRWRWAPTRRGGWGALESDWDMQAPMARMDMHGYGVLRRLTRMESEDVDMENSI